MCPEGHILLFCNWFGCLFPSGTFGHNMPGFTFGFASSTSDVNQLVRDNPLRPGTCPSRTHYHLTECACHPSQALVEPITNCHNVHVILTGLSTFPRNRSSSLPSSPFHIIGTPFRCNSINFAKFFGLNFANKNLFKKWKNKTKKHWMEKSINRRKKERENKVCVWKKLKWR